MTLDQIKQDILDAIDRAWHALIGTADVDAARQVVAETTATLSGHVSAAGQQLFDHVVGNADAAKAAEQPAPSATAESAPADGAPVAESADGGHVAGGSTSETVDEPSQGS